MVSKIEVLMGDLFRYVLHKNDIYSEGNLKLSESPPISEDSEFTEEIGRAVLLFSYVYRVMFKHRFYKSAMTILRRTAAFDTYVEKFCSRSTENSDYFIEFFVTLAFVTELAAYCYAVGSSNFCSLPAEAFIKVFNKHMKSEFLSRGGFEKLQENATRLSRPYEIMENIIQTESPANDILPILEGASYLGLGEGFFTAEKVTVREPAPETKQEENGSKTEATAAEGAAAEASATAYSGELVVTENDVILDKIMASIIHKRETGSFSTIIPGASRTENWPELSEDDESEAIPEEARSDGDGEEAEDIDEAQQERPEAEETKQEEPEAEETKQEQPEAEETKQEQPEAEETKQEQPEAEETKQEQPEAEETKQEQPEAEETKQEQPEAELPSGDLKAAQESREDKELPEQAEGQGASAQKDQPSARGKKQGRQKRKNRYSRK